MGETRGNPEVILISSEARLISALLRSSRVRVRCFSSTADYDAWRAAGTRETAVLGSLVDRLVDCDGYPPQLQLALDWLRNQASVPPLKVFAEVACPRRTFFRAWSRAVQISPAEFLQRL